MKIDLLEEKIARFILPDYINKFNDISKNIKKEFIDYILNEFRGWEICPNQTHIIIFQYGSHEYNESLPHISMEIISHNISNGKNIATIEFCNNNFITMSNSNFTFDYSATKLIKIPNNTPLNTPSYEYEFKFIDKFSSTAYKTFGEVLNFIFKKCEKNISTHA